MRLFAVGLDFDRNGDPSAVVEALAGLTGVVHSTRSHKPLAPRCRAILLLSRPVTASEYAILWGALDERCRIAGLEVDRATKDTSRLWFLPSLAAEGDSVFIEFNGEPLDVDGLLEREAIQSLEPVRREPIASKRHGYTGTDYAHTILAISCDALRDAPRGSRNSTLAKEAYAIGGLVGSGVLSEGEAECALLDAVAGWDLSADRLTKTTLTKQLRAGMARPRELPEPRKRMHEDQPSNDTTKTYNRTDAGNAERFRDEHGHRFRFCAGRGWMVFGGSHWERDNLGERFRAWKQTARRMIREANDVVDETMRKQAFAWAFHCEQTSAITATLKSAESELPIATTIEAFDRDVLLLNAQNCTVDLRTGLSRLHAPEDMLSKRAGADYDEHAKCPVFEAFLESIFGGDKDLIAFLQRFLGYCLTGDVREQVLLFCHGAGSNGKSTLIETVLAMAGDYAMAGAPGLLMAKKGDTHPTEQADLLGARLVSCVEIGDGKRFDEERVKALTGGDKIKARYMREDFFSFDATHKLLIAANHKPQVHGTDFAIWRRILLVPFNVKFTDAQKDTTLKAKLLAELPGILHWTVEGCLAWQKEGLQPPAIVTAATTAYRAEQDVLGRFIADTCNVNPLIRDRLSVGATALYAVFVRWCEDTGEHAVTQRRFGDSLSEKGFEHGVRDRSGKKTWQGIGLVAEQSEQSEPYFPMSSSHSPRDALMPTKGSEGSEGSAFNRRAS